MKGKSGGEKSPFSLIKYSSVWRVGRWAQEPSGWPVPGPLHLLLPQFPAVITEPRNLLLDRQESAGIHKEPEDGPAAAAHTLRTAHQSKVAAQTKCAPLLGLSGLPRV